MNKSERGIYGEGEGEVRLLAAGMGEGRAREFFELSVSVMQVGKSGEFSVSRLVCMYMLCFVR